MLQSITAAVTKSVLGELQKAGIIASQSQHDGQIQHDTQSITQPGGPPNHAHPDQHQDNELSQTVTTAPPDEAQQRASSTTTLNNIDSVQLPAMLFANTTKKTDGMSEFSNTSYKPLGRPLYTQINGKLQEKISANEFVDMADILDPLQILNLMIFIFRLNTMEGLAYHRVKRKSTLQLRHGRMHSSYLHLF